MNDDIHDQREHQEQVANEASDAVRDLARAVNTGTVTAPAAYAVLGNQKLMLHHLEEVNDRLIHGLRSSLTDDRITVVDRHFITGTERDPETQISHATQLLETARNALAHAAHAVATAQEVLNSQGFTAAVTN
ncbi:hypothetical protein FOJ82_00465 [Tessaracoccus rhinocerotis]|uniref:Uncharacterized protein n=1 Tax=Tessaracoccus rhinocerotis TaxID=1689449 RepID=A0A553K404_9ACTN|nr:hypothetical protein [Tessaracoccus rhinocerotis]TRY19425.1 hypothetical protein FOJ82_00465 [Tessaracoccus rhinocerotis]